MIDQPDLANMSEADLLKAILEAKANKKMWDDALKMFESEILFRNDEMIRAELGKKDDPFGTIYVGDLKFNAPKSVIWDQEKLGAIHADIVQSGADPSQYMVTSYKVKESAFKNWPKDLQDAFIDARTVKAGAVKLVLEDGE